MVWHRGRAFVRRCLLHTSQSGAAVCLKNHFRQFDVGALVWGLF